MRIIIIFLAIFLNANIIKKNNIDILNSLDIDRSFLYYKPLQKEYNFYLDKQKEFFLKILERGYEILPVIRKNVLEAKLPKYFISVAMAESYFKLKAYSKKRAAGLWQFMPYTAKRFGLRIDDYVDERRDPIKSTIAAIKYFKYLHNFFGKWYLAILAYNAGEARVVEAVVRAKVDKLCEKLGKKCKKDKIIKNYRKIIKNYQLKGRKNFPQLYTLYLKLKNIPVSLKDLLIFQKGLKRQYLPKETRRYILKILAMSFIFNSNKFIKYSNSYILNSGIIPEFTKIYVTPGTSLYYVANILDMDYKILKDKNLHLKYSFTPPYKYYIYIPYKKVLAFKQKFVPNKRYFYVYRIQKGDSLYLIAKKFGVKVKIIKDFNKISKFIYPNQKLIIPTKKQFITYKVKPGDSLSIISKKFNTSLEEIKKINNLKTDMIKINQVLKIPIKG